MIVHLLGSVTGRLAVVLCLLTVALPYGLRRGRFARRLGIGQDHTVPYLRRMWPHFWVGYGIVVLSVIHVGAVMGSMGRANSAGVWSATVGLFLLVFEVATGLTLKEQTLPARKAVRSIHFWTMVVLGSALGLHVWWNG